MQSVTCLYFYLVSNICIYFKMCESRNITLGIILIRNSKLSFDARHCLAGIELGIENTMKTYDVEFNVVFGYIDGGCEVINSTGLVSDFIYGKEVKVVYGGFCTSDIAAAALFTSTMQIPLVSPVSTYIFLERSYQHLIRFALNGLDILKIFNTFIDYYGWDNYVIIYHEDFIDNTPLQALLKYTFSEEHIFKYIDDEDYLRSKLQDFKNTARVACLFLNGKQLRKLLLLSYKMNMTNGEFVFIHINMFKSVQEGSFTWQINEGDDNLILQGYKNLLFIEPYHNNTDEYKKFVKQVLIRSFNKMNEELDASEISDYLFNFYDSLTLLGFCVNKTFYEKSNLIDCLKTSRFPGITHTIEMNGQGSLFKMYEVLNLNFLTLQYETIGHISEKDLKYVPNDRLIWWMTDFPPPSIPLCGYRNERCAERVLGSLEIAIIFFALLILTVLGIYLGRFSLNRFKEEAQLQVEAWAIEEEDLEFTEVVDNDQYLDFHTEANFFPPLSISLT